MDIVLQAKTAHGRQRICQLGEQWRVLREVKSNGKAAMLCTPKLHSPASPVRADKLGAPLRVVISDNDPDFIWSEVGSPTPVEPELELASAEDWAQRYAPNFSNTVELKEGE